MLNRTCLFTVDGQTARTSSTEGYDSGLNGLEADGKLYMLWGSVDTKQKQNFFDINQQIALLKFYWISLDTHFSEMSRCR